MWPEKRGSKTLENPARKKRPTTDQLSRKFDQSDPSAQPGMHAALLALQRTEGRCETGPLCVWRGGGSLVPFDWLALCNMAPFDFFVGALVPLDALLQTSSFFLGSGGRGRGLGAV